MTSFDLKSFKNQTVEQFEMLADQVGLFFNDLSELNDLLNTAGEAARESLMYQQALGVFLHRMMLES